MHIKYYYWTVGILLASLVTILCIFGFTVYHDFQKVIAEKKEQRLEEEIDGKNDWLQEKVLDKNAKTE